MQFAGVDCKRIAANQTILHNAHDSQLSRHVLTLEKTFL